MRRLSYSNPRYVCQRNILASRTMQNDMKEMQKKRKVENKIEDENLPRVSYIMKGL